MLQNIRTLFPFSKLVICMNQNFFLKKKEYNNGFWRGGRGGDPFSQAPIINKNLHDFFFSSQMKISISVSSFPSRLEI